MDNRVTSTSGLRPILIAAAVVSLTCSGEAPAAAQARSSASTASQQGATTPITTPQQSGTTNRLQAVSPVDEKVVWASGVAGTYAVTTDGGATWTSHVVPGAETLQFRDVQGVSAKVAYLLSAGVGSDSRIYKTEDGGTTWTLQFQATDPNDFYDCFAFWTPTRGLAMADGVNGRFPVLRTRDGKTWTNIGGNLPAAQAGEGAFAASGTCVATQGEKRAWIVTTNSRVFATRDGGESWAAYATPIVGGTGTAGVFTVAFRNPAHGIIGGGDFVGAGVVDNVARSSDGGKTWKLTAQAPVPGAVFGLSYVQDIGDDQEEDGEQDGGGEQDGDGLPKTVVVTGPGGAAWTPDEGDTWHALAGVTGYWAVGFASPRAGWLVGTKGRILKISF
jgi:photosystem II stability/assembly factor-like uncharacterized protein